MEIFEVLKVLVLGIVEGFTEWLPISSTGHMILVEEIIPLHLSEDFKNVFMVVVQLGAILAVVVLYFHKLNPFSSRKKRSQKQETLSLWIKIIIACLPAAIVGLPFDDILDAYLMKSYVVATTLILYGVLFIVLENHNAHTTFPIQKTSQISYQTALFIGLFQLLSLIPGTSRSGSTILGAMILGCSRGGGRVFLFPGNSGYVWGQPVKNREIWPYVYRAGDWIPVNRNGYFLYCIHSVNQIPVKLCPETRLQILWLLPDYIRRNCICIFWNVSIDCIKGSFCKKLIP